MKRSQRETLPTNYERIGAARTLLMYSYGRTTTVPVYSSATMYRGTATAVLRTECF